MGLRRTKMDESRRAKQRFARTKQRFVLHFRRS